MAPLRGEVSQVPSAVSAIKVGGRRAYQLVREGHQVELEARPVRIDRFEALAVRPAPDGLIDLDVEVDCSSGTYIRALAATSASRSAWADTDVVAAHPRRTLRTGPGAHTRRSDGAAAAELESRRGLPVDVSTSRPHSRGSRSDRQWPGTCRGRDRRRLCRQRRPRPGDSAVAGRGLADSVGGGYPPGDALVSPG